MTTPSHDDQAHDLSDTLFELKRTLWAFQGLGELLHPDHDLNGDARANVSFLVSVLTERCSTLLEAAIEAEYDLRQAPAHPPIVQGPSGPAQA